MKLIAVLLGLAVTACQRPALDMIRIAPGTYRVGSSPAELAEAARRPGAHAGSETPSRAVVIDRPFAVARTEVTRTAFLRFVRATKRRPGGPCGFLADPRTGRWGSDTAHDWRNPGFAQTGRHPAVCVGIDDTRAYAAWLSTGTGRTFRLPNGVEWEIAARAGTATARWWGDAAPCAFANVSGRERAASGRAADFDCDDRHATTAPVASYRANAWGLHDMLGNVWEWTDDCAVPAPQGCAAWFDRGGSWVNSPFYLRAAVRHPDRADARTTVLGFRLAEDLP